MITLVVHTSNPGLLIETKHVNPNTVVIEDQRAVGHEALLSYQLTLVEILTYHVNKESVKHKCDKFFTVCTNFFHYIDFFFIFGIKYYIYDSQSLI